MSLKKNKHFLILQMNKLGLDINILMTFQANPDAKNVSYRVLEIDQPDLGLEREFLLEGFDHEDVQSYLRYMVETVQLIVPDKDLEGKTCNQIVLKGRMTQ